jgi:hypothetical protein
MQKYSYNGPERRRFSRIPFGYIIKCRMSLPAKDNTSKDSESVSSKSKNISLGGILIETKRFYTPSTIVEIEIDVPLDVGQNINVAIKGLVVRCIQIGEDKIFDTAIKFISAPKEYQPRIKQLIKAFANV